jgi:hypothetical protein
VGKKNGGETVIDGREKTQSLPVLTTQTVKISAEIKKTEATASMNKGFYHALNSNGTPAMKSLNSNFQCGQVKLSMARSH